MSNDFLPLPYDNAFIGIILFLWAKLTETNFYRHPCMQPYHSNGIYSLRNGGNIDLYQVQRTSQISSIAKIFEQGALEGHEPFTAGTISELSPSP